MGRRREKLIDPGFLKSTLKMIIEIPNVTMLEIAKESGVDISTVQRNISKFRSFGVEIVNYGTCKKPDYRIDDWGIINADVLLDSSKEEELTHG